jgi:uncharacterized protein YegJ (DUF2314 family)
LFEHSFISDEERSRAVSGRTTIRVTLRGDNCDLLRHRKLVLRYLRAVLGRDGAVAIDDVAQKVWPREALDDELEHDADLDIEGIYSIHAVQDEGEQAPHWVHTHGLTEIGHFDFDIVEPSPGLTTMFGMEVIRAMAFRIVEGTGGEEDSPIPLVQPGGEVSLVPVDEFLLNSTHPSAARLRSQMDPYHRHKHKVLCDPQRRGLLGRLFRRGLAPSRFLSGSIDENLVIPFSRDSSLLTARRARGTYSQLLRLSEEFAEFELPVLVKLGYPVDDARDDEREHLWFRVHQVCPATIEATLVNQPFKVSSLKQGQRGTHDPDLLTDWMILTPVGTINPRSTTAARNMRAAPELVRRALEEAGSPG